MKVDPDLGPQTVRSWSARLGIPYGQLRTAVKTGDLVYYRFTTNGPQYITPEDMQNFLDRSRFNDDPDPMFMTPTPGTD